MSCGYRALILVMPRRALSTVGVMRLALREESLAGLQRGVDLQGTPSFMGGA